MYVVRKTQQGHVVLHVMYAKQKRTGASAHATSRFFHVDFCICNDWERILQRRLDFAYASHKEALLQCMSDKNKLMQFSSHCFIRLCDIQVNERPKRQY